MSETEPTPLPLEYSAPGKGRVPVILLKIALACWLVPFIAGVGTLGLYALTFEDSLTSIGLMILGGGFILLFIGLACVYQFRANIRHCDPPTRERWSSRSKVATSLLLSNVLVGGACAMAGISLMSICRITLVNQTASPVTSITVNGPGDTASITHLAPGEQRRVYISPRTDGEITFVGMQNNAPVKGIASGYVSSGLGDRSRVTFTNAGPVVTSQ